MIEFAKLISNLAVSFINISIDEIDEGVKKALKRIGEYAQADRSYVFLYSDDGNQMSKVFEWVANGITPEIENLQNFPVDQFPWFNARIKDGRMVIVPRVADLPKEAKNEKEEWTREEIKSLISLPMYFQGEYIGFIGFDSVQEETKWQEETLALLQISGEMIASVMARRDAEEAQKTKFEEISVLHSLSMVMAEADTVEELLLGALNILGETFTSDNYGIAMKDEDSGMIHAIFSSSDEKYKKESFPIGIGIVGRALRTGKTIVVDDVSKDPDYHDLFKGAKSELCVPLKSGDQTIGVVNIESKKTAAFTQRDQHLIEIFSRQLVVGWEKLSLFEQVQELAIRDSLTGMFNRRHFFELAETKFAEAKRYGHPLSAIMLDVDDFKEVNDVYGHGLGDQVLEALGDVFEAGLRVSDIAGRYGGDEFVVLLTGSDINAARILAGRLDEIAKDLITSGTRGTVNVTISQGIATMDETTRSLEILLDRADQALLTAKREGPNQVRMWGENVFE